MNGQPFFKKKAALALGVFLVVGICSYSQVIIPDSMKDAILYEYSGLKALDYIYQLCTFDRSGASRGLHESQIWVQDKLESWGIKEVRMDAHPADGKTLALGSYPARYAWEKTSAVLSLVEPTPYKIIDFAEIPTALVKYSNPARVTAEVVDIGAGMSEEDYEGKDVRGKIVLTSGNAYTVYSAAIIERGALGIISYWNNYEPDRSPFPDQVPWMAFPQELDTRSFGFAVSRNIADDLKILLDRGRVVVKAEVDAEVKIGEQYVLSSGILGSEIPEKEIILTAHINHNKPGANDNASGCALVMETLRTIQSLVAQGKIPPPKRTIRGVWMGEHSGTKIYLDSRPDLADRGVIALNLDMVGEDILQCESSLRLVLAPHSRASFLDDLMDNLMRFVSRQNFTENRGTKLPFTFIHEKYNGAISDHFYYPAEGIAIPTSFIYLWPDNFYHSNEDSPDKCDPTMLKRLGFVAAAVALYVASAGEKEAVDLCRLVSTGGLKRISDEADECGNLLRNRGSHPLYAVYKEAVNKLHFRKKTEEKALNSVFRITRTAELEQTVDSHIELLGQIVAIHQSHLEATYRDLCAQAGEDVRNLTLSALEKKLKAQIPKRHFRGPLDLRYAKTKMSPESARWFDEADEHIPDFFLIRDEIINYIDNTNSILDIRNAVSAEFHPLTLDDVFRFISGLKEAGFVTFKE